MSDYAHSFAHAEAMKAFHKVYEQTMAKIRREEVRAQKAVAAAAKAASRGTPSFGIPVLQGPVTNPYYTPY
jgi:phage tail tape-measure protein